MADRKQHKASNGAEGHDTGQQDTTIDQSNQEVQGHQVNIGEMSGNIAQIGDQIGGDKIGGDKISGDKIVHIHHDAPSDPEKPRLDYEPKVVLIPAGPFSMGNESGESTPEGETLPEEIDLPQYWISKSPISIKQFAVFLRWVKGSAIFWSEVGRKIAPPPGWADNLVSPPGWSDENPPDDSTETDPVQGVTWFEAVAYCEWLKERSGRAYTLPTEAQWEKAAKQNTGTVIQWGQVREWTRTIWGVSRTEPDQKYGYPYLEDDEARNRLDAGHYLYRVYRGKGYAGDEETFITTRGGFLPYYHGPSTNLHGFRVVYLRKSDDD